MGVDVSTDTWRFTLVNRDYKVSKEVCYVMGGHWLFMLRVVFAYIPSYLGSTIQN